MSKNKKISISDLQTIGKNANCTLRSMNYKKNTDRLEWICNKCEKEFTRSYAQINSRGLICRKCNPVKFNEKFSKNILFEIKAEAMRRGGECLSEIYANNHTPLLFKCNNCTKQWKSNYSNFKQGKWCPECSSGISERACRVVFESLMKKPFPPARPSWLKRRNGSQLQLDGFNEELSLAFEHQGIQHYKFVKRFHKNIKGFNLVQARDKEKLEICKNHHINLIYIPQVFSLTKLEDLAEFISNELSRIGIKHKITEIDFTTIWQKSNAENIEVIKFLVAKKEGTLVSTSYLGSKYKYEVMCKSGHLFKINIDNLRSGKWCPSCSKYRVRYSIDDMHNFAQSKNGKCLSVKYISNDSKLKWLCENGHIFFKEYSKVRTGQWCNQCSKRKRIEYKDLVELAKKKNGKILEKEYLGGKILHRWQCNHCKNIWKATVSNVKNNKRWCPKCASKKNGLIKRNNTLEKIQMYAKSKGGKCVSKEFIGRDKKLNFRCRNNHYFERTQAEIFRHKRWCDKCIKL